MIRLKDQVIKNPEFLKPLLAHFIIKDGNLQITLPFDTRSFADLLYLQLMGKNPFDMAEKENAGMTTTDIVKKYYQEGEEID